MFISAETGRAMSLSRCGRGLVTSTHCTSEQQSHQSDAALLRFQTNVRYADDVTRPTSDDEFRGAEVYEPNTRASTANVDAPSNGSPVHGF